MKKILLLILILFGCATLAYAGLIGFVYYKETSTPIPTNYDSIIILGAQVLPDGTPNVQLQLRLDLGAEYYFKNPSVYIVTSGAQGKDEPMPEGIAMKNYLISKGIPEEKIISEIDSRTTKENIAFSFNLLNELSCTNPVIITSDYHLPRALQIAKDAGLENPQGAGAFTRTELNFWFKNRGREALAWVKYWLIAMGLPL